MSEHEQHEHETARGAADSGEDGLAVPVRRRRARSGTGAEGSKKGLLLVVGLVGIGSAIAAMALLGLKDNAIYSKPVDQLLAERSKLTGRPVRAEGTLVPGSLMKRESPCEYKFVIEKNGQAMPVRFGQCVVPDTFRDVPGMDVAVTVEGELQKDGSFEATNVLAKCPSKYEMEQRANSGEQAPHLAIPSKLGNPVGTR